MRDKTLGGIAIGAGKFLHPPVREPGVHGADGGERGAVWGAHCVSGRGARGLEVGWITAGLEVYID
jgi:hypothetical protein